MPTPAIAPDLQQLLDQAARLQRRLNFRKDATKVLETRLENLRSKIAILVPASGAEAIATKGGGKSFNLPAVGGFNVRVTQPANKLLGKISGELVMTIRNLIGAERFSRLFLTHYTCAKNIRLLALQELEKPIADELIRLVEEPSVATVTIS